VASNDRIMQQRNAQVNAGADRRLTGGSSPASPTVSPSFLARQAALQSQALPSVPAIRNGQTLTNNLPNMPAMPATLPEIVGEQYLVFSLFEREFAFKAEHIQGVERLVDVTPVPNVASWVQGVINLRGSIASVVDLRAFLGLERLPYNPRTRLLSVQYNEMVICLAVDAVSGMVPVPDTAIINGNAHQNLIPSWIYDYASGSALLDRRLVVLLDAARLLFSEKMQRYTD
jgi:purine-binding chemotaxis protein CheW